MQNKGAVSDQIISFIRHSVSAQLISYIRPSARPVDYWAIEREASE